MSYAEKKTRNIILESLKSVSEEISSNDVFKKEVLDYEVMAHYSDEANSEENFDHSSRRRRRLANQRSKKTIQLPFSGDGGEMEFSSEEVEKKNMNNDDITSKTLI
jgi:hypothetical protein